MRKNKSRRLLSVLLCMVLVGCLSVPAFAASDDLGYQYVFEEEFTFAEFSSASLEGWYVVPLDVAPIAEQVKADCVNFSIDSYTYRTSFKKAERSVTYHYIGNALDHFGFGDDTDEPYLLIICPDDSTKNALYLRSDLFSPLFAGDNARLHVTMSVASNDLFATGSLLEQVGIMFNSAMNMVGATARTVIGNPILLAPIVIGLAGLGIVFYRRLKN